MEIHFYLVKRVCSDPDYQEYRPFPDQYYPYACADDFLEFAGIDQQLLPSHVSLVITKSEPKHGNAIKARLIQFLFSSGIVEQEDGTEMCLDNALFQHLRERGLELSTWYWVTTYIHDEE